MLARGRVGNDYTTGLFTDGARPQHEHLLRETTLRARSATSSVVAAIAWATPRRVRHVITRLQVALSTKNDPSPPPRAAQARSACGKSRMSSSSTENLYVCGAEGCGSRRSRSTFCGILALLPWRPPPTLRLQQPLLRPFRGPPAPYVRSFLSPSTTVC